MPIWLRKFTFNKLKEFYEEESKQLSKANKSSNITPPKGPDVRKPTYTSKVKK